MFKNIQSITYTEKDQNEDTYYFDEDIAFVIDGASSLIKNDKSNYIVHNFVNEIKKYLIIYLKENISIGDALLKSLKFALKMDLDKEFIMNDVSAAISIIRIKDEFLEIFYLGDCNILIEYVNSYELFSCEKLNYLDSIVKKRMVDISKEENNSILETRYHKDINDLLIKNRSLKNKDNGYYTLDTVGNGINKAYSKRIKLNSIKSILICSDGFSQSYDTLNIYDDYKSIINRIRTNSIENIQREILNIQNDDYLLNKYPRFYKTDDITAIYLEL